MGSLYVYIFHIYERLGNEGASKKGIKVLITLNENVKMHTMQNTSSTPRGQSVEQSYAENTLTTDMCTPTWNELVCFIRYPSLVQACKT